MSFFHENMLIGSSGQGGAAGYQIERSLRFNRPDSSNLSRTFASAGSRTTWTFSCWVKRSTFGITNRIFREINGFEALIFDGNDKLAYYSDDGTTVSYFTSTAAFRDPSAWYHVVLVWNSDNATATDRERLYVNGVRLAGSYVTTQPTLNQLSRINTAVEHNVSSAVNGHDGYLADAHFVDGQALTPSSFGEFDTNNVWQPKAYSGTYGTNGFRLDFSDNSAATATTLGKDRAGSNNWTPNNLSVTAGAGNDSLVDSPSNYGTDTGAGGEVRGNYCTLNPLHVGTNQARLTLSNGNLDASWAASGSTYAIVTGSIAISSGKWYWESTQNNTSRLEFGIVPSSASLGSNYAGAIGFAYASTGVFYYNGSYISPGTSFTTNDICGIALDLDAGKIWFSKNGTWIAAGNPASGTNPIHSGISGTFVPAYSDDSSTVSSPSVSCNFGQRPFAYTAPSGFKALCTQNLPTPTITNGATAMDVKLYTGNGGTQTISGLSFSPDFVWIKGRSFSPNHRLYDQIRGATKSLSSDLKNVEGTETTGLTAFTSDGFSLGAQIGHNGSGDTYVAWCWDAGSSTVTNTSGTISSQVRANASAGFSIVSFTSTATTTATVGHGLGVAPDMIILKDRNGSTYDWLVYFGKRTDVVANRAALYLNTSGEGATDNNTPWLSTSPTSSVFTVGGTNLGQYGTMIAYCFAAVNSYSSFGQYTGNGSTDGPFVYTNMRPRWILIKRTNLAANWTIIDTARRGYNVDNEPLYPNLSNNEGTTDLADILSNGFKLRSTDASVNASGGIYVYACFAENPFALARAR